MGGYRFNNSSWGSNYGNKLDVVAPGENITTTSGGGYTNSYEKTWAAAAHVSGVAALMLSVNPN
jgi:subtilisin family serine protease